MDTLVDEKLCSRWTDDELRAEERKDKQASGSYVEAVSCNSELSNLRAFLIDVVIPEFILDLRSK